MHACRAGCGPDPSGGIPPGRHCAAMARRTLDGSMDFRPRRTSKRLRDLPFPKNVRTSRATGTVRRARLGRQPLQAVRQRRAGFGRPGPRRRIQLELRNGRSGPVAKTRQKYAGSRRMELRGNETGRPGQLQPDRVDRTGQHSGRRGRQYERQLAVQPQRLLQTAPGASTVIMPQDRASRSTRPPTPGAGKRPDSTTRHGTKRRPA